MSSRKLPVMVHWKATHGNLYGCMRNQNGNL